ncbi:MAG: hypothetical protein Q8P18_12945 [Pseudomonadota bacterium]|nr:hypothetical protein [Pseudomonadota bacterium]
MILLLAACAPAPPVTLTAAPTPSGVRVEASAPITRVELRSATGVPLARRTTPAPTPKVEVIAPLAPGAYTAVVTVGDHAPMIAPFTVPVRRPVTVEVQPQPGGAWVEATGTLSVPLVAGGSTEVLVGITGGPGKPDGVPFSLRSPQGTPANAPVGASAVPSSPDTIPLPVPGARVVRPVRVRDTPVVLTVGDTTFTLLPAPIALATLAATVTLTGEAFPAEIDGSPDLGRPAHRVSLPSPAWERIIRAVGLGGRRRDEVAPWAFWGVTLRNEGDTPVDLQVSLTIHDASDGAAGSDPARAPAFRPRLRDGDGDTGIVAALLRVPAHGTARAALPVFVDTAVVTPGAYDARLTLTPIGGDTPLSVTTLPLYVRRGDAVASVGFTLSLAAFAGGAGLTLRRVRAWLDAAATSELMTIALFGSALFLVGTIADLLAMGVGALLGPLSTLLTGILSDLGRYTLLATLITLLPRVGTLTLAILTGWFLRGFTTGSFAPVDLLYTGTAIGIGEAFAWLAGLTRGGGTAREGAWRDDGPGRRWARLSFGFGGAAVCTTLAGLWMHIILFRLFFAPWYMAMQVLVPGLLYTVLACRIATGFAASLRRVEA